MKDERVNKIKISYILNWIIIALCIFAFIIMFTGIKITPLKEPILETTKFGAFRFFTVDSNLLMGISALIFVIKERKVLANKIKKIPKWCYILKFMATVSVSLTMLVVFLYLSKIAEGGLLSLLQNSNLFFHFIIPFLSIVTFVLFEKTKEIKLSYVACGLIPVLLYGIGYVINILNHFESGKVLPKYDWYYFAQNGVKGMYYTAIGIFIFTFIISLILWLLNNEKIFKKV